MFELEKNAKLPLKHLTVIYSWDNNAFRAYNARSPHLGTVSFPAAKTARMQSEEVLFGYARLVLGDNAIENFTVIPEGKGYSFPAR